MSFPNVDWVSTKANVKAVFDEHGTDTNFTLVGGETGTLKTTSGFRREAGLTDGTQQEVHRVRVYADDWDAEFTRPPEKGDILVRAGRRHAVENAHLTEVSGYKLVYVMIIQG